MQKQIVVYENWSDVMPKKIGILYVDYAKGKENFSFEYDEEWLSSNKSALVIDPDLAIYNGRQFVPLGKTLFGIFADSSPDRW